MIREYKYKVILIYANLDDARKNKRLEKPRFLGVYSGESPLRAIYEAVKDKGYHIDCMATELVKESK